jgi:hypothetical protein
VAKLSNFTFTTGRPIWTGGRGEARPHFFSRLPEILTEPNNMRECRGGPYPTTNTHTYSLESVQLLNGQSKVTKNDLGALGCFFRWKLEVCPIIDVLSISSTSQCCTISKQHCVDIVSFSSCLHRSYRRHCNVVPYRINIVSTLWSFVLFILSTSRCYTISNQHRVDNVILSSCLHRSPRNYVRYRIKSSRHCEPFFLFIYCRHRDVVRYRINIVLTLWIFRLVYIVHIVDMAMLYNIDVGQNRCRRCWHKRNNNDVDSVNSTWCQYCWHSNVNNVDDLDIVGKEQRQCELDIVSTLQCWRYWIHKLEIETKGSEIDIRGHFKTVRWSVSLDQTS